MSDSHTDGHTNNNTLFTNTSKGHVLEVAAGTGRNFDYYPKKNVHSLTLLDSSAAMLRNAALKAKEGVAFTGYPPADALMPLYVANLGNHVG